MKDRQRRFADEYLIDLNAEAAAVRAGYSPRYARGNAGYIGIYNRYDKVPKEVWSAHVYTVGAEAEDVLSVMIEDEK